MDRVYLEPGGPLHDFLESRGSARQTNVTSVISIESIFWQDANGTHFLSGLHPIPERTAPTPPLTAPSRRSTIPRTLCEHTWVRIWGAIDKLVLRMILT